MKQSGKFNLFNEMINSIYQNKCRVKNGDIIMISSKYISNSQGRILDLSCVNVSHEGYNLSRRFMIEPKIAEIILREADTIYGGVFGYIITLSNNVLAPNSGIDKSNIKKGNVVLYPYKPFLIAEQLKRKFFLEFLVHVGVIITDSRLIPSRIGTTGTALACSGINPVLDRRAENDLNGNLLKVTIQATADNLASISNQLMGEGSDLIPMVIIRNSNIELTDRKIGPREMNISSKQCIYIRGLINSKIIV